VVGVAFAEAGVDIAVEAGPEVRIWEAVTLVVVAVTLVVAATSGAATVAAGIAKRSCRKL
jgi:hypothetical protein